MTLGVILLSALMLTTGDLQVFEENSLVGIWTVTDFADPKLFSDTWEFRKNGKWSELKRVDEGSKRKKKMRPDENGTWDLKENVLATICTGERDSKGKRCLFDEPVVWKFIVEKVGADLKLEMIEDSNRHPRVGSILRLTRKADGRRS